MPMGLDHMDIAERVAREWFRVPAAVFDELLDLFSEVRLAETLWKAWCTQGGVSA